MTRLVKLTSEQALLAYEVLHAAVHEETAVAARGLRVLVGSGCDVRVVMVAWVDLYLIKAGYVCHGQQPVVGRHVRLRWATESGGTLRAAEVPGLGQWAGQLMAARLAGDDPMWNALLAVPPEQEQRDYLVALLVTVARSVRAECGPQALCPAGAEGSTSG